MTSSDRVPFLDLVTVHRELEDELLAVVEAALDTAGFIGGPMVQEFEREFAGVLRVAILRRNGQRYGRAAPRADRGRRQPGDTVVTVPLTFIATTEAISQAGARPDFVDVDERTYTMDPEKLRAYLETECRRDPRTRPCGEQAHGAAR